MEIAEVRHRSDLVEARPHVAERRRGGEMPVTRSAPKEDHDRRATANAACRTGRRPGRPAERSRERPGRRASPGVRRADAACGELEKRVAREQDMANDLRSATGRAGAAADEHQAEQHHLGLSFHSWKSALAKPEVVMIESTWNIEVRTGSPRAAASPQREPRACWPPARRPCRPETPRLRENPDVAARSAR